jgi:ligand-binding SRPBCC domain-containing protein
VPRPLDDVFPFFADAMNLERITPPFLRFRILTPPPILMRAGALIDYRLRLYGVSFRWLTRIESWEPPFAFTDVQLVGPYRSWIHRHDFLAVPGGTEVCDRVDYALPLGRAGALARRVFVRRRLERIFDFRTAAIARALAR